jgi:L-lactate utilization protein LutB
MKTPMEIRYDKLGPKVVKALQSRSFEAWYFDSPEEAVQKALSLIPKTDTVAWGGSLTCDGLGLIKQISEGGWKVIDRDKGKTPEERAELQRQSFLSDSYVIGTNAISEDGQLVNVDGMGNRVAAITYGPKQVIILAGMNKVAKTLDDAMIRARTIAAPANMQRFPGKKTPCSETGACGNCVSPDCICNYILTIRNSRPVGRIKVILIGKDLGL